MKKTTSLITLLLVSLLFVCFKTGKKKVMLPQKITLEMKRFSSVKYFTYNANQEIVKEMGIYNGVDTVYVFVEYKGTKEQRQIEVSNARDGDTAMRYLVFESNGKIDSAYMYSRDGKTVGELLEFKYKDGLLSQIDLLNYKERNLEISSFYEYNDKGEIYREHMKGYGSISVDSDYTITYTSHKNLFCDLSYSQKVFWLRFMGGGNYSYLSDHLENTIVSNSSDYLMESKVKNVVLNKRKRVVSFISDEKSDHGGETKVTITY